ncbi:hypothetical protein PHYBOEH_001225 [Phytophthora boehmeriae]|uniref:Mitochondrial cardiolipin hydrolase n=1 Tax=Phytophthora boehmeriae TaxID=109152 RepID=A0A8T1WUK1_9STRA|nr:hypothetical protein PHYBOEH_001225 [Phytophthora boehmeriae]
MPRGKTLQQDEVPGLLELLRKHQRYVRKWKKSVPDFKGVSRISHRCIDLLHRVWDKCQDGSPLRPAKKTGPAQKPQNTPEALAGKLLWMTPEQQQSTAYARKAAGMSDATFRRLKPQAMELLEQIPRTMFLKADRAQQTRLLNHIRAAKPGESICIAEYAFTLKDFSDALVEQKRAGVTMYVLVDLTWSKSCRNALNVIRNLQAAGIDVKHLGSQRMHFKLVVVGITYAAGGSANLSFAGFHKNADYIVEVEGRSEGVASAKVLFEEEYNCEHARLAQAHEVGAALANLAAKKAALEAEKAAGKKRKRSNRSTVFDSQ